MVEIFEVVACFCFMFSLQLSWLSPSRAIASLKILLCCAHIFIYKNCQQSKRKGVCIHFLCMLKIHCWHLFHFGTLGV